MPMFADWLPRGRNPEHYIRSAPEKEGYGSGDGIAKGQTYHSKPHHPSATKMVPYEEVEATSAERAEAVAAHEDASFGIVLNIGRGQSRLATELV